MNKSYYAIIPANVRYDDRLTPNAKLLYGEIMALSGEDGICFKNNKYFAELYKKSKVTISQYISQLRKYGYIKTRMFHKEGTKQIINRQIKIINLIKDK